MKKILIVITAALLSTLTVNGQDLFFIGENSYTCTETMALKSNSDDDDDLNILLAKDGNIGLFAVIAESYFGAIFSEKLIIYLDDGTVITCNDRKASDYVDERAKAVYPLTGDQLNKLKNSNLHTVRYTLETRSDQGLLSDMELNRSASNKGIPTKTIISDFLEGKIIDSVEYIGNVERIEEAERIRKAEEEARLKREAEEREQRRSDIFNRTRNALNNAGSTGTNTNTNQGVAGGEGNHGVETGSVDSKVYGAGTGTGTEGVSYDLAGRQDRSLPKPKYDIQSEGIVVVEVTVDRNGNVTKATPGVKGSTTLEEYFLRVAREAAMTAKFDRKPDAPVIQKGTITYHFIIR